MDKIKVKISYDEWYPVYYFTTQFFEDDFVEVDIDTLNRFRSVFAEFDKVQKELLSLYPKKKFK